MRSMVRSLLMLAVVVAAAFVLLAYLSGADVRGWIERPGPPAGAADSVDRARERGAQIGEKAAMATAKVEESLSEAGLTAKIKAKMALDDIVKARQIDVTTRDTTVTLTGSVGSQIERDRAVALAKETAGVMRVIDNLQVR